MKILLTGAEGQVGKSCQRLWQKLPNHLHTLEKGGLVEGALVAGGKLLAEGELIAVGRSALDITSRKQVTDFLQRERPDVVINCAAYTAVDKAESDVEAANAVNHLGPKNLATVCQSIDAMMVHISTDYVYEPPSEGGPLHAFQETDACFPINQYGKTKLLGENAVLEACEKRFILRTAWVFSADGNNFVKTMLKLAKTREELSVVYDQMGCPTFSDDIAKAIAVLILKGMDANQTSQSPPWGVYNYCGDVGVSWHEFARHIFSSACHLGLLTSQPKLNGIPTKEYPTPAKRPSYSVMDTQKIESLGVEPSFWKKRLLEVLPLISS